jgi:acetyltransferase
MIVSELISPDSIVVVGASHDTSKPGGKVLKNILEHNYVGRLYAVNPKPFVMKGVVCYDSCEVLPAVDMAIIAIAAPMVEECIRILTIKKKCKAFIIFSAGFGEIGEIGKALEQRCVALVQSVGGTLIGPNCIGVLTPSYKGVFAGPIPNFDPKGCDCVSASGATMVFLLEEAIPRGLTFSSIFSVGNSAQIGVEEILEYWDATFDSTASSRIKLLYMEEIANPLKFYKHARSLTDKGCRIAAIKAGSTEAGSRAVSSHTGSLSGSNTAVNALFRKAGILRCHSRVELVYAAAIFAHKQLHGNRIAVITHAGGPGVMLTDILTRGGMQVPHLEGAKADELRTKLFPGSSVANPIDFLATGTADQLGVILDYVDHEFDEIDGSVVVFGTTGMWSVNNVYEMLHRKMQTCTKPIFPILPSVILAAEEVSNFQAFGRINFTDEVSFGYVLSRVQRIQKPFPEPVLPEVDEKRIRKIIDEAGNGYLLPDLVYQLLNAAHITQARQFTVYSKNEAVNTATQTGFPLVMKVIGPLHKSDVGGVKLGIQNKSGVEDAFTDLMNIEGATGVVVQEMLSGHEIFMGAKKEDKFGHVILCGLGGIFVEVFKDVSAGLAPIGMDESLSMIRHLASYPIIQGTRGNEGVNEQLLAQTIMKLSAILRVAPEIMEMDINPLLGTMKHVTAVDARIRIQK